MIVVMGATGALNGATLEELLKRVPAAELGASVRDAAKAKRFAERGVRVRTGSYEDAEALRDSFAGADQVLVVSSNDPFADHVAQHRTAIRAAVDAGASRILYTAHQNAVPDGPFLPSRGHAATEAVLAESGVAWTSLRNGFYAHSLAWLLGPWRETGVIETPADGPVSWTWREDSAEAAAIILTGSTPHEGPVTLTASEAPDFAEIAEMLSELTGRPIGREVVADEAWLERQVQGGAPEGQARFALGFFQAARLGHFATVDPTLRELLGRQPRTVRQQLALLAA